MTRRDEACEAYAGLTRDEAMNSDSGFDNEGQSVGEGGFGQNQSYGAPPEEMKIPPFGTGMIEVSGEGQDIRMEDTKKRLAKRANQIYRRLCDDLAIRECFFYGFSAWSEFVDGRINETKFYEAAKAEAQDVVARSR